MLFNSLGYILLLILAVPLHWMLPRRARVGFLGAVSLLFYAMWRWEFCLLVVFSAVVDFTAARRIHASDSRPARRAWLVLSLVVNLGLLAAFKYTYFVWDNIRFFGAQAGADWPALQDLGVRIILPLGISFYTFQTISYSIDVYRRVIRPTSHFVTFLTYVMFWPQLIAGPVLRAGEVLPQLEADRRLSRRSLELGILLVLTGLFKKVVLADSLAPVVDEIFAMDAGRLNALDVWVGTFLFGFQIYFDFAGYSTIAIGSALLVGLHFPANFNWPYMSRSPREFWRCWHISLSAWIRDYLYLPLTGQQFRTSSVGGIAVATAGDGRRTFRALMLTWFIMGLWHGAAWTFALWGLYHAALIALYRVVRPLRLLPERAPFVAWVVLLFASMGSWISFRATSLEQAVTMFSRVLNPLAYNLGGRQVDFYAYFWAGAFTVGMAVAWIVKERLISGAREPGRAFGALQCVGVAVMTCAVLTCLRTETQFIYFQF